MASRLAEPEIDAPSASTACATSIAERPLEPLVMRLASSRVAPSSEAAQRQRPEELVGEADGRQARIDHVDHGDPLDLIPSVCRADSLAVACGVAARWGAVAQPATSENSINDLAGGLLRFGEQLDHRHPVGRQIGLGDALHVAVCGRRRGDLAR